MKTYNVLMDSLHLNRRPILTNLLTKKESHLPKSQNSEARIFWGAESYKLERSTAFLMASHEVQQRILGQLGQNRLEEAYHIEKAGIAFGAKMILESETFEERKLYAHFTGEESEHLSMIESYLTYISDDHLNNSFLLFLEEIIKTAPKNVLVFLIQVILEGWGIEHYSELAKTCKASDLKAALKKIVQDEAGHHGSGLVLFKEEALSEDELRLANTLFQSFLSMVQIGPYTLAKLAQEELNLGEVELSLFLDEIDAHSDTQKKLNSLKSLALRAGAIHSVKLMEEAKFFTALPNEALIQLLK